MCRQGLGHEPLGERLDVLVAIDSITHGALASRVNQAVRVRPAKTNNAPELALANAPLNGKQHLAQSMGLSTDVLGLVEDVQGLSRGIEDALLIGQYHRSWTLGARVGTYQRFGLEVANLDAVLEDAHQNQGADGGRACCVAAVVNAHAGVVIDGALGLGEILHTEDGKCLQVGLLFFEHGLHLAALTAVDTGGGPGHFPVLQKVVLLFDGFKAPALEGGRLGVADGILDGAFRISIQLQTISSIRIRFFGSPTPFIRSMDKSLL